eukprot:108347-Chlamydomonas_euryale.AAC.4
MVKFWSLVDSLTLQGGGGGILFSDAYGIGLPRNTQWASSSGALYWQVECTKQLANGWSQPQPTPRSSNREQRYCSTSIALRSLPSGPFDLARR